MDPHQKKIVNVYVDGFNFYYGVLRRKYPQHKWLNIHEFIRQVLISQKAKGDSPIDIDDKTVIKIKYFTARIETLHLPLCSGQENKYKAVFRFLLTLCNGKAEKENKLYERSQKDKVRLQKNYLELLKYQMNIKVVEGYYSGTGKHSRLKSFPEVKKINNKLCLTGKEFLTRKIEEKGSDVNLAVQLVTDSYRDKYGKWAVVISNDSDLQGAIKSVQRLCNKEVLVINPHTSKKSSKTRLESVAKSHLRLHALDNLVELLEKSQFPAEVTLKDGKGKEFTIKSPYIKNLQKND